MNWPAIKRRSVLSRKSTVIVSAAAAVALISFAIVGHELGDGGGDVNMKVAPPQTVIVAPLTLAYRVAGEFLQDGLAVDAPLIDIGFSGPIYMMKYQVSASDYARCVIDESCMPTDTRNLGSKRVALTGVSFVDAQSYAAWLSKRTGQVWRLPTDEEWVLAAGSRFADDALGLGPDARNPSKRWIAEYQRNAELDVESDANPKAPGYYGENEYGIADLSGNVWEWTSSCYVRANVSNDGTIERVTTTNCGVRVVEGRHRTYMTDFVRDAKSGGCAVGTPPDNLGFRLVRESTKSPLISALETWWLDGTP